MSRARLLFLFTDWARPVLLGLVALVLVGALLTYRLDTLTPGASAREIEFVAAAKTADQVISDPLHLYQKAGNAALYQLDWHSAFTARMLNALLGLLAVMSFYLILKRWYTTRVSLLGTALFACSSWLLLTVRSAAPDASFLLPLGLVVSGVWLRSGYHKQAAVPIAVATLILLLYVPAMIWFILAALFWQRQLVRDTLADLSAMWQAVVIVALILALAPLGWAFLHQPELLRTWLGLPTQLPQPTEYLKNLLNTPFNLFIHGAGDPTAGIGRLPLLDAFTAAMFMLGAYVNVARIKLDRSKLMLGVTAAGVFLAALGGPLSADFLLPFIYLTVAGGIALLLRQWLTVFPRNPLVRTLGITIVAVTVSIACYYHLTKYFVAWPAAPATQSTFQYQI